MLIQWMFGQIAMSLGAQLHYTLCCFSASHMQIDLQTYDVTHSLLKKPHTCMYQHFKNGSAHGNNNK